MKNEWNIKIISRAGERAKEKKSPHIDIKQRDLVQQKSLHKFTEGIAFPDKFIFRRTFAVFWFPGAT